MRKHVPIIITSAATCFLALLLGSTSPDLQDAQMQKQRFFLFQGTHEHEAVINGKMVSGEMKTVFKIDTHTGQVWRYQDFTDTSKDQWTDSRGWVSIVELPSSK